MATVTETAGTISANHFSRTRAWGNNIRAGLGDENDPVNDYWRRFDCRLTAVKLVNPSELKLRDIRGSDFSQGAVPAPVERA
jgi:hypothetical protein